MSWREELDSYLRENAKPTHKFGHQPRLYALTVAIAARTEPKPVYDDDVVYAAAYLHDLGVFVGHRPEDPAELVKWNHVVYTCERTPEVLLGYGFPEEKIPAVLACIREHQPHDAPQSFEAILLRDADILEQLGAIGVMRTVTKVGSDTRFHTFADALHSLRRSLEQLPPKLQLGAARELAQPKMIALSNFLDALEGEAGEHLG